MSAAGLDALVAVELLKLRRSLAFVLCLVAPTAVALLGFLIAVDKSRGVDWSMYLTSGVAIWGYFMLPMTVTALTLLLAQMEHGPKAWNHLLALPIARPKLFAAKLLTAFGLVAAMTFGLLPLLAAGGVAARWVEPAVGLPGAPDLAGALPLLGRIAGGALLMTVIQLWVALRFASFVPPLVLGIGGTLVAVAATSARQGIYFPWLLPVNALGTADRADIALQVGGVGGLLAAAAMLVDLSRAR